MATVDYDAIAEATGWNLSNVEALRQELAVAWSQRLDLAGGLQSAVQGAVYQVLSSPVIASTVSKVGAAIGPLTAALGAWNSVVAGFQQDLKENAAINVERMFRARDLSIESTYRVGNWWTVAEIKAPTNPQLKKDYGQSLSSFTGQVSPAGFVYSAARGSGRKDVLRPSWLVPGPEQVYASGGTQTIVGQLGGLPSYKMANGSILDCAGEGETSCQFESGDFPKYWKWLQKPASWICIPFDLSDGCSVPARAWWPYCLGAAPAWGYLGQQFPFSPLAQTIATALRSPTPLHLAVSSQEVLASLYSIVERCKIGSLPVDPGQQANGVFRRGVRLILRGEAAQLWSPISGLQEGQLYIPARGVDLQTVIEAHLEFLALRRAILLSLPLQTPELRAAAEQQKGRDLQTYKASQGELPSLAYNANDPLNLYSDAPADQQGKPPKMPGWAKGGAKLTGQATSSGAAPLVVAGGLGLAALLWR